MCGSGAIRSASPLIIGAWNEPYMLTLAPLVAAIAGGKG
jgi:hypothetical protein